MPSAEVLTFAVAALLAGGLSMGGVTLIYFRDKWRVDDDAEPTLDHAASIDRTGDTVTGRAPEVRGEA